MNADSTKEPDAAQDGGEAWHMTDLFVLIWRRRLLVGGTVFIVAAAAIIAAFVITPVYTANASFMGPPEESNLSAFLRSPLNAVLKRGGGATVDRLLSFLNSETTLRLIIKRFDLQDHYKAKRFADALQHLKDATTTVVAPEGVIKLTYTDRDPRLAADVANTYVDITDSLFRRATTKHAGELRRFLEARVNENRAEIARTETKAREFAQEHGVVSLPDQVSALVDQMAEVEAKIRALDVKIGATRHVLGPEHYSLQEMEFERAQLEAQRRSLIEPRGADAKDPLLSFGDVPRLALEYARLERTMKILAIVQELLVRQYEMARLDELRTVSSLTRVDRAVPPEVRSWPRRGRIVILSTVMGIVWAILLAAFVEAWPSLRRGIDRSGKRFAERDARRMS